MALNKRKVSVATRATSHTNHEGGVSFDINDPFTRLQVAATSCFFGEPAYYVAGDSAPKGAPTNHGGMYMWNLDPNVAKEFGTRLIQSERKNTRELMESAIDDCLNVDIERTLQFAVELRNEWHMRATPQVIMVRAAMHADSANTGLIGMYSDKIMSRLDEVMNQMAYFESVQGTLRRVPSRLKRAWANRLSQANEYELAKYKLSSRSVNIYDAIRIAHPKGDNIDKLMAGEIGLGNEGVNTWESIRSSGGSWKDAVRVMGHMALLRNLRNLNADGEINREVLDRLVEGVEKGKQFPFRYWSAFKATGDANADLVDAIETCLEQSIKFTAPRFTGKGLSIVDVSASMNQPLSSNSQVIVSEISRLMGIIAAKSHENGADLMMFGNHSKTFAIRKKSTIFDEMRRIEGNHGCGHGTNITGAIQDATNSGVSYDVIWVFSDMQCGYIGDVPTRIKEYRNKVNPNAQVFFVNLAGHQDSLVPEFYDKTYMLGGWSDKVLQFADKIIGITN